MSTSAAPAETPAMPPKHAIVGDLNTEAKCIVDLLIPHDGRWITLEALRTNLTDMGAIDLRVGRSPVQLYDLVKNMGRTVLEFQEPETDKKAQGDEILIRHRPEPVEAASLAISGLFLDCSLASGRALRSVLGERRATPSAGVDDAIQARLLVLEGLINAHHEQDGGSFKKSAVTRAVQQHLPVNNLLPAAHMRRLVEAGILENVDDQGKVVRFAEGSDETPPFQVVSDILGVINGVISHLDDYISRGVQRGKQIVEQPDVVRGLMTRSFVSSGHTGKTRAAAS